MEFLKAAPEQLAKFVSFITLFARSPHAALEPYAVPKGGRPSVSGQLILFCALSVGCGTLMVTIGGAIGMAEDRSTILVLLRRIDSKALPLVVALAIMAVSGIWHGLTRIVSAVLGSVDPHLRFHGALENSLNAGLAFGTLYVVALTAVLVTVRVAVAHTSLPWFVYLLASLSLGVAFLVYFILAFATFHRVAPSRYFLLFGFTMVAIRLLTRWLGSANA